MKNRRMVFLALLYAFLLAIPTLSFSADVPQSTVFLVAEN